MSKEQEEVVSPTKGGGAGGRTKEFVNWMKKAFNKSPSPQKRRFLSLDSINSPPSKPLVFGVDLDELTLGSSHKVPFIVRKIVEYIEENGLTEQGLYRVNGNTRLINELKNTFDKIGNADFSSVDTATVGGLLKLWLRELPTPVIPDEVVPDFVQIQETNVGHASPERLAQLREAIHKLPKPNFELLKYLIRHLIKVTEHSAQNKMASVPLSIVFGPSIFRCGSGLQGLKDQGYTNSVVCRLIQNYEDIFEQDQPHPPSVASPVGPRVMSPDHNPTSGDTPSSRGGREEPHPSPIEPVTTEGPPGSTHSRRRFLSLDSGKPLVFGVSLERLNLSSSDKVPFIVRKIVEHIEENGLSEQGLYRVNGNTRLINDLRNIFDKKGDADFTYVDTATAGGLLKLWLRELPTPVIPDEVVPDFVQIQETNVGHASPEQLAQLREAIHKLPKPNFELLKYLIRHLIKVTEHSAQNKMASVPLSIVFGPSIFRCGSGLQGLKDQGYTNSVVCRLIQNYEDIFEQDQPHPPSVASPVGPRVMSPDHNPTSGNTPSSRGGREEPPGSRTFTSSTGVTKNRHKSGLFTPANAGSGEDSTDSGPVPRGDVIGPVSRGDVIGPVPRGDVIDPVPRGDVIDPVLRGHAAKGSKLSTGTFVATPFLGAQVLNGRGTRVATDLGSEGRLSNEAPLRTADRTAPAITTHTTTTTNSRVRVRDMVASLNAGPGHQAQEGKQSGGTGDETGPVEDIDEPLFGKDGKLLTGTKPGSLSSTYPVSHTTSQVRPANTDRLSATSRADDQPSPKAPKKRSLHHDARGVHSSEGVGGTPPGHHEGVGGTPPGRHEGVGGTPPGRHEGVGGTPPGRHGSRRESSESIRREEKTAKLAVTADHTGSPVLLIVESGTEEQKSPFQRQYAKRKLAYAPLKRDKVEAPDHSEAESKSPLTRAESPWQSQASLKRVSSVIQTCIDLHLSGASVPAHYMGSNVYGLLIPAEGETGKAPRAQPSTGPHSKDNEHQSTPRDDRVTTREHQTKAEHSQIVTGRQQTTEEHSHRTLKGTTSWSQPDLTTSDRGNDGDTGETTRSQPDPILAKRTGERSQQPEPSPARRRRLKAAGGSSRSPPDPPAKESASSLSTTIPGTLPGTLHGVHPGTLSGVLPVTPPGSLTGSLTETLPGTLPGNGSLRMSISSMLLLLEEKRRKEKRPYKIWDMTPQQLQAEKHALQKILLQFEKKHGKPVSKDERELVRPLYERYRDVKRLYHQNEKLSSTCAF
ncbi:hypothetical protein EMCRGX_G022687 [Ephydatia muelleri]